MRKLFSLGCLCLLSSSSALAQEKPVDVNWTPRTTASFSHAAHSVVQCYTCHQPVPAFSEIRWEGLPVSSNPLGVNVQAVSPELKGVLELSKPAVLVVGESQPASPGFQAGLQLYDIILSADQSNIESKLMLDKLVAAKAGKQLLLKLLRHRKEIDLNIAVPDITSSAATKAANDIRLLVEAKAVATAQSKVKLGVVLAAVDNVLRSHLNLPAGEGVLITGVSEDGPAAKVGCEANDIFLELDGKHLTSEEQLKGLIQEIGEKEVLLKLLRRGKNIEVKITPQLTKESAISIVDIDAAGDVDLATRFLVNQFHSLDLVYTKAMADKAKTDSVIEAGNPIQKIKASVSELQARIEQIVRELEAMEK